MLHCSIFSQPFTTSVRIYIYHTFGAFSPVYCSRGLGTTRTQTTSARLGQLSILLRTAILVVSQWSTGCSETGSHLRASSLP